MRVWYAEGEEFEDAEVIEVSDAGTIFVAYKNFDLEEEVPLAYIFAEESAQHNVVTKESDEQYLEEPKGDENKELGEDAETEQEDTASLASSKVSSPPSRKRSPSAALSAFTKGSFVEVNKGASDGGRDQWLPAVVKKATENQSFEVRVFGLDEDEAEFEVGASLVREIPMRKDFGTANVTNPSILVEDFPVRVWYAEGEEFQDAEVIEVSDAGTIFVTYKDFDLEEEVPLAYIFASNATREEVPTAACLRAASAAAEAEVEASKAAAAAKKVADFEVACAKRENEKLKAQKASGAAAARIQALHRGRSRRRQSAHELTSAAKIQAVHRGRTARRLEQKKSAEAKAKEIAVFRDDAAAKRNTRQGDVSSSSQADSHSGSISTGTNGREKRKTMEEISRARAEERERKLDEARAKAVQEEIARQKLVDDEAAEKLKKVKTRAAAKKHIADEKEAAHKAKIEVALNVAIPFRQRHC